MVKKVKIYGQGWVGKSMLSLFPDSLIQDPFQNYISHEYADISFVCVPTPCLNKGRLDTSIVEDVVKNCDSELIVVRSTVNPGDCDRWEEKYSKNIVFIPEYLGETPAHPLLNEKTVPFIVIGGRPDNCRKLIELYTSVYNANITIRQMTLLEAEVVKLTENRAIAFKVAQCQELYDACEKNGVDYYKIRDAVYGDDPRFNLWFTFIFPHKRGFNSKCIPKDVYAWNEWAGKPDLTTKLLEVNDVLVSNNTK
jgi:UDP-glucose 6-dehydrogenase